jgi:DNA-binding response OmpR family regulator
MQRILVVEDDLQIAHVLKRGLTYKGFAVTVATSGTAALEDVRTGRQDLVVLDVMLPDMDGFEVCRSLREMKGKTFPILMLTARDGVTDTIDGLESGADDYITKPFDFEEVLARIRAALRRVTDMAQPAQKIEVGDLTLDPASRQVWRGGHAIELTKREYDLLELLARNAGLVLTKERIFERVWGYDNEAGQEIIKVYINYLRAKINIAGKPDLLHAVRGVGYTLKA